VRPSLAALIGSGCAYSWDGAARPFSTSTAHECGHMITKLRLVLTSPRDTEHTFCISVRVQLLTIMPGGRRAQSTRRDREG
jgi:hypothetical protein